MTRDEITHLFCSFLGYPIKTTYLESSENSYTGYDEVTIYSNREIRTVTYNNQTFLHDDEILDKDCFYCPNFSNNWADLMMVVKRINYFYFEDKDSLSYLIDYLLDGNILSVYNECLCLVEKIDTEIVCG